MNNDTKLFIDEALNNYKIIDSLHGYMRVNRKDHMFTSMDIIKGMYDKFDSAFWKNKDHTVLDIACKSGGFLVEAYCRFMVGLEDSIPNAKARHVHILFNQLYGIATCETLAYLVRRVLYGNLWIKGNILQVADHGSMAKYGYTTFKHEMNERQLNIMKFDVVIGNPPYNKGMDLDFVNLGFELCTKYCAMITPAKWQTADENQRIQSSISYGEFREKIVPHMSQVVFYPDCKDIFDIYQTDGITYYLIDKQNRHENCTVTNISNTRGNIINGTEVRDIKGAESLLNIGNKIIKSLEPYKRFKFSSIHGGKEYSVYTNTKVSGYDWYVPKEARYVMSISRVIHSGAGQTYDGESKIVFESNSKEECESFISWLNTRFTRFFLIPNVSKLNGILTDHCFRFVPAPPPTASGNPWDHIYTDAELYKHFKLSQEYIGIIEALVKERT